MIFIFEKINEKNEKSYKSENSFKKDNLDIFSFDPSIMNANDNVIYIDLENHSTNVLKYFKTSLKNKKKVLIISSFQSLDINQIISSNKRLILNDSYIYLNYNATFFFKSNLEVKIDTYNDIKNYLENLNK